MKRITTIDLWITRDEIFDFVKKHYKLKGVTKKDFSLSFNGIKISKYEVDEFDDNDKKNKSNKNNTRTNKT